MAGIFCCTLDLLLLGNRFGDRGGLRRGLGLCGELVNRVLTWSGGPLCFEAYETAVLWYPARLNPNEQPMAVARKAPYASSAKGTAFVNKKCYTHTKVSQLTTS